jgi:hypothetical protein
MPADLPTWDLFARHETPDAPAQFLALTALRESRLDPEADNGTARGLLQITRIALAEYNRTRGTAYTWADLTDPEINVRIGAGLVADIVRDYRNAGVAELRPDWLSREWVALLTLGWSAGYSRASGVIHVARTLKQERQPVTARSVVERAKTLPTAHRQLARPAKLAWAEEGAAMYFGDVPHPQPTTRPGARRKASGFWDSWQMPLALAIVLYAIARGDRLTGRRR